MSAESIHKLMAELGPALDLAEVMAFPEQRLWTLAFDDGQVVECETDAGGTRVNFSIETGDVASDAACRVLLQFGLLWGQTGGQRFSLAGDTAMLNVELPADSLDLPTMSTLLTNLHGQAGQWRAFLAAPAGAMQPVDTGGLPGGALRV